MNVSDFADLQARVFDLYNAGEFERALEVATHEAAHFPADRDEIVYWRICLAARTEQPSLAMWILEETLSTGSWWGVETLRRDPDLAGLQGHPDFERLVEICAQRQLEAARRAAPGLMTVEPSGGATPPWPVLVALHGGGSNAAATLPLWSAAASLGWMLALPQSSVPSGPSRYTWLEEQAETEVVRHVSRLRTWTQVDAGAVVLAGTSRGGAVALRLALTGAVPARGVVAVVPGVRDPRAFDDVAAGAAKRGLRVWLVLGGRDVDGSRPALAMAAALSEAGVACEVDFRDDLAHRFPGDFDGTLERALEFVAG